MTRLHNTSLFLQTTTSAPLLSAAETPVSIAQSRSIPPSSIAAAVRARWNADFVSVFHKASSSKLSDLPGEALAGLGNIWGEGQAALDALKGGRDSAEGAIVEGGTSRTNLPPR